LVSKEENIPYSLCGLPDYLSGEIPFKTLALFEDDFFTKNNINLLLGKEAIKVDPSRKRVFLKNNSANDGSEMLEYDKLLIAIGSKPIVPNIPGLNKKNVYVLSNLKSCKNIINGLKKAKKIAVIGSGFVGIECAQALKNRGKEVFVIEILDHILANMFDEEISSIAQNMLENLGINFILGNQVKEIIGNETVEGLQLKNGKMDCDMVVFTIGFNPNIDLVKNSMISVNRGIIVNDFMESNTKGIYAAGDVAESFDCIYRKPGVKATWSNAVEQGHIAGLNIAGKRCKYLGYHSYNVIDINDVPFLSMGNVTNLPKNCSSVVSKGINSSRKVFIKNNRIVGIELYGDITNSGHLFSLINKASDIKGYNKYILSNNFQYRWNRNINVKSMIK
ncbi:MAG: NAD(P)/FAD-dependent oxidoreductase, partial [Thermoplasmatales archaeon]